MTKTPTPTAWWNALNEEQRVYCAAIVIGSILFYVVIAVLLAILWRRLMPRAIAFVKAQYPNSWNLPSTSRWLWFTALLAFAACFVIPGAIADLANVVRLKPDSWATVAVMMSMLVIFVGGLWTAGFALRLKRRLAAEVTHAFVPRWATLHSTVELIALSAPGMPQTIRQWSERWVIPVERSWRCDVCGNIRHSQKHTSEDK
jgi:hypothetical protein